MWRARAAWVGWTLLLWIAISSFVGLYLSDLRGFEGNGGALENVVASVVSLAAAVLLRIYWPALRSWNSGSSDWAIQHRAVTITLYAVGFGLIWWLLNRDAVSGAFGAGIGGVLGWLSLRREAHKRRGSDEHSA